MTFRDRWVLVTGASSGLGRAMATMLATEYGANILAVARRADKLEELRRDVEPSGAKLMPIVADLSRLEEVDRVLKEATESVRIYAAILNAGVTHFGHYHELSWTSFEMMLRTNIVSTARMTTELLPYLEKQDEGGGVMLVSSMAGMTPIPYQAAYSGTKSFIMSFGQSLWHELRGKNVSITTYAPGGIATEMTQGNEFGLLRRWLMPADAAAREGIEAFRRRKYVHVPGKTNRLGSVLMKMLPGKLVGGRLAVTYRRSLDAAAARRGRV